MNDSEVAELAARIEAVPVPDALALPVYNDGRPLGAYLRELLTELLNEGEMFSPKYGIANDDWQETLAITLAQAVGITAVDEDGYTLLSAEASKLLGAKLASIVETVFNAPTADATVTGGGIEVRCGTCAHFDRHYSTATEGSCRGVPPGRRDVYDASPFPVVVETDRCPLWAQPRSPRDYVTLIQEAHIP